MANISAVGVGPRVGIIGIGGDGQKTSAVPFVTIDTAGVGSKSGNTGLGGNAYLIPGIPIPGPPLPPSLPPTSNSGPEEADVATATFTAAPRSSTDAEFRDWGLKFATALAAVGMVKTADTGQIDWATVAKPTSNGVKMGYEIWRFNDSLQATYPLFLRIDYAAGVQAGSAPGVFIAIGKGSNGAGVLTSPFPNPLSNMQTSFYASSGTSTPWYFSSADGSSLCWAMAPAVYLAGSGGWFTLERARTAAGVPVGAAFSVSHAYGSSPSAGPKGTYVASYGSATVASASYTNGFPNNGNLYDINMAIGAGPAPVSPFVYFDQAAGVWQGRSILMGMRLDLPVLVPFTIPGWGPYLPIGPASQESSSDYRTFAMVWS